MDDDDDDGDDNEEDEDEDVACDEDEEEVGDGATGGGFDAAADLRVLRSFSRANSASYCSLSAARSRSNRASSN